MKSSVLNSKCILLIGSGRLAFHLQFWNSLQDCPNQMLTWNRSQDSESLSLALEKADLVWLAISDSAIISFFENNLSDLTVPVVHFSGALHDLRLKCAHPLMTFPTELLNKSIYYQISFALTGVDALTEIMPGFKNNYFKLSPADKPLYHALCVVAGNFPQLLWTETTKKFETLNIPESAIQVYLNQVLNNFLNLKQKSVTGPLVRNDITTMELNENALSGTKLHSVYRAFRKEFSL